MDRFRKILLHKLVTCSKLFKFETEKYSTKVLKAVMLRFPNKKKLGNYKMSRKPKKIEQILIFYMCCAQYILNSYEIILAFFVTQTNQTIFSL